MNKKIVIKILAGFMVLAVLLTYVSRQIYNAALPIVATTETFSAAMRVSDNAVGKINFTDITRYTSPVSLLVDEVYVKVGERVLEGKELLKLNIISLETSKEQLQNQIAEAVKASEAEEAKSDKVILLQLEIANLELSLFRSDKELQKLIEDKKHEADIVAYEEKIEETNLQMKLALEALYNYEAPLRVDGEERSLMRAVERIKVQLKDSSLTPEKRAELEEQLKSAELDLQVYRKIPSSLSSGYDISQELNLKLAVLQAQNTLLETDEYYNTEKNSAQLEYEAVLYEYQQSQSKNAQEAQIAEKKLELSIEQYQEQLVELKKTDSIKKRTNMEIKGLKNNLVLLEELIKNKGMVLCRENGEIIEITALENEPIAAQAVMLKLCNNNKAANIVWKMESDEFMVKDQISAELTVLESQKNEKESSNADDSGAEEFTEKAKSVKLAVTSKRFIAEENCFEYTAAIPLYDKEKQADDKGVRLAMSNSQTVTLSMNKLRDEYETVVPISAISFIDERKGTLFCAVENEQGKLIARKIEVEILDYDNKNAALEKSIKGKIVVFSDRPLKSEGVIRENV